MWKYKDKTFQLAWLTKSILSRQWLFWEKFINNISLLSEIRLMKWVNSQIFSETPKYLWQLKVHNNTKQIQVDLSYVTESSASSFPHLSLLLPQQYNSRWLLTRFIFYLCSWLHYDHNLYHLKWIISCTWIY